jgi:hypothetical protein
MNRRSSADRGRIAAQRWTWMARSDQCSPEEDCPDQADTVRRWGVIEGGTANGPARDCKEGCERSASAGCIVATPEVGGLQHRDERVAA